jgi:hypothetical protein
MPIILATWEAEIGRLAVSSRKKLQAESSRKAGHSGTCQATWEAEMRRTAV